MKSPHLALSQLQLQNSFIADSKNNISARLRYVQYEEEEDDAQSDMSLNHHAFLHDVEDTWALQLDEKILDAKLQKTATRSVIITQPRMNSSPTAPLDYRPAYEDEDEIIDQDRQNEGVEYKSNASQANLPRLGLYCEQPTDVYEL